MPCTAAQLGVSVCPCRAQVDDDEYSRIATLARRGMTEDASLLLDPLEARMARLAGNERFEEAAATRDRLSALARALQRRQVVEQLHATQRLLLDTPEGRVELRRGRMVLPEDRDTFDDMAGPSPSAIVPERDEIDELLTVARWLGSHAQSVRVVTTRGTFASALPRLATYAATRSRAAASR
jgi:DNA polymerase-3 subunit epsilon